MRSAPSPHPVVAAAAAMVPMVEAAAEEIETEGRLPAAIVERLTETGLYHLFLPRTAGGPEVDPISALLAIETLARADGSVAWCAQVSSANAWQFAALAPDVVAEMLAPPARASFSGSARPLGSARPVKGGYIVNGRWDFASNCLHAGWYCGTCVLDGEDGRRRARSLFMPISAGEIVPTWQVAGLRGSGSHDFAVEELFVPEERAAAGRHLAAQTGPLYRQRLTMVANWAPTAGVSLGLARAAIDVFTEMSSQGTANVVDIPLRDRADVQDAVGRAEAMLGAARSYCLDAAAAVWEAIDGDDLDALIRAARLAITHAMHTAVQVVTLLFQAGGTRSIFNRAGLERRFRDAYVAVQHGAGSPSHFKAGGRLVLGLPAGAPFW